LGRRLAAPRGAGGDGVFLAKGSAALEKLKDLCKEGKEKAQHSTILQLYTQAVLDITYFEESQLVDEDFAGESSLQKVKELICILSDPEDLVRECSINEEPVNILSTDLVECLYWRKGALLYMYCHTAKERSEWMRGNIALFKKCLNDGVHYLLKMLSFRCPLHLDGDVSLQDKDTARLLSEGKKKATAKASMPVRKQRCSTCYRHGSEVQPRFGGTAVGDKNYRHERHAAWKEIARQKGCAALTYVTAGKGVAPPRVSVPHSPREKARSAGAAARAHGAAAALMAALCSFSVSRCRAR
ncbi:UPF0600 protein C5orf51 homolog, partial [Meleagris gallopavo]|uniref:UPF0600 protein C5orf51 homolog n=1 Tax=Meleagris gallopavo TaxID=9103 RepID=UPI00093F88AD